MDTAAFKEWVGKLPELTVTQRNDALMRFKLLSSSKEELHTGKKEFGDRVVAAICDVMRKNKVECPSLLTLKKSNAYVAGRGKLQDLQNFFDTISSSRLVQDRILRESIDLLYHDLLGWSGINISSHTILQQAHRLPSVLNRNFPGYAACGNLHKIVKRR